MRGVGFPIRLVAVSLAVLACFCPVLDAASGAPAAGRTPTPGHAPGIVAAPPSGTPGPSAQTPVNQPPVPRPSLAINSFRIHRCVPSSMMSSGAPQPPQQPWYTTDLGEPVCLAWAIEGCRMAAVDVVLAGGNPPGSWPLQPGTRVDLGNGCFRISNEKEKNLVRSGVYTLTASGGQPSASASRSYELVLRRPVLTLMAPVIADVAETGPFAGRVNAYTLTFSVQNTGDLEFRHHAIGIRCEIDYLFPYRRWEGETLFRAEHLTQGMGSPVVTIPVRQQAALGAMHVEIPGVRGSEIGFPAGYPGYVAGKLRGGTCRVSSAYDGVETAAPVTFVWSE